MKFSLILIAVLALVGCTSNESELNSAKDAFSINCEGTTNSFNVVNEKDILISTKKSDINIINFKEGKVLDDDFECNRWDEEKIVCEKLIDAEELIYSSKFTINRKSGSINWVIEERDNNLKQHTKDIFEGVCK